MPSIANPDDVRYMRRCLELASMGEGFTRPNPMVGSVIVHNGKIIGEGYHRKAGTPHAEVHAINSVANKELLKESTLYVSLEPCSHFGKTPPCADLIISSGIPRVVAGTTDTSARVSGKGFKKLRDAGVEVITGVDEAACRSINRRFFTFHEKQRPWIVLKWAESADGYIDFLRKQGDPIGPNWITGISERVLVHRWRASEDAILAGGATIRSDNPGLDVRLWSGNNPVRVIVSKSGDISPESKVFAAPGKVLLFTANEKVMTPCSEVFIVKEKEIPLNIILGGLYNSGIQSVIVEGGACILNSFISAGLWDEARIFKGEKFFGSGVKAPLITGKQIREQSFEHSTLRIMMPESSETMII